MSARPRAEPSFRGEDVGASLPCPPGPCPNWTYNGNNQNTAFTYDAAGNVTNDGLHTYAWDAEGRLKSIDGGGTANLTFNALGRRVYRTYASSSPVSYWLDPAGNFIGGIWAGAQGSGWNAEVPFAGRILAMYNCGSQGPMCFDHPNALGV